MNTEYPKLETLYDRDPQTFKVNTAALRCPEFGLVHRWLVSEKIDGTNVRVFLGDGGVVTYGGRTDAAQMPTTLLAWLQTHLPGPLVASAFDAGTKAILYGEGYGAGINKGGVYRAGPAFRLFDVLVYDGDRRWWLNWSSVEDIAKKLNVPTVPVLQYEATIAQALTLLRFPSKAAQEDSGSVSEQEGIVARTEPLLMLRDGRRRLMWKLKGRDFDPAGRM